MRLKTKFSKVTVLMLAFLLVMGSTLTFAKDEETSLVLSYYRYVNGQKKYAYKYSTADTNGQEGTTGKKIFQIMSSDKTKTNYYCLNATVGDSWTGDGATLNEENPTPASYNGSFDLNDADDLAKLRIEETTDVRDVYKNVAKSQYFNQIWWILDNMYIPGTDNKQDFLAEAGIVKGKFAGGETGINGKPVEQHDTYKYEAKSGFNYNGKVSNTGKIGWGYYDTNSIFQMVELPDELIEVAGQAALWYFTNHLDNNSNNSQVYNVKEQGLKLAYSTNGNDWMTLQNAFKTDTNMQNYKANIGMWQEEQATILCWYLIDAANKYAAEIDAGTIEAGEPLKVTNSTTEINEKTQGTKEYEVVGPIKIEEKRVATYTLDNITIKVDGTEKSNTEAYISNSEGVQEEKQNILDYIGKDFYVAIPKSTINGGSKVEIGFSGTYKTNSKKLWTNKTMDEQPIVEVAPGTEPINLKITATREDNRIFDLALRKKIVSVNGSNFMNEENKDATRTININPSPLSNNDTTAAYNHRKDPVVVKKGDIVKYQITIYNEGDIDGYAKTIVDKLPTGLRLKGRETGEITTVSGSKYSYDYDASTNTVTFTNETKKMISAYKKDGFLIPDKIDIECEVIQEPSSTTNTYLTNIAYIAEDYNEENKPDRDSHPTESPSATQERNENQYNGYKGNTTNSSVYDYYDNNHYFKGEEDDDDFEIVVLKPAEFDLKLMKFISKINDKDSGRRITVDTTRLDNGQDTTANYNVSKNPLKVKTGDYVEYTFNIYNEGDIDGYASEISEDIPDGLEFVYDTNIIANTDGTLDFSQTTGLTDKDKEVIEQNINSSWSIAEVDKNGRITKIKTDYLSKDKSKNVLDLPADYTPERYPYLATSSTKLIKAYDSSIMKDGPDFRQVSVILKVVASPKETGVITNNAAITRDQDKNGKPIDDRDSDSDENNKIDENWKKENSDENYDNDPKYPKYKEDDEDYDNIILEKVDLALTKFIVAISDDMKFEDGEYLTKDTTSKNPGEESNPYIRQTAVDTTKLKNGTATTADYIQVKTPLTIPEQSYVLYNIRVYNEGDVDVFAGEVTDYLPDYLSFVSTNSEDDINNKYGWKLDTDGKTVRTSYLAYTDKKDKILKAFDKEKDDGKGSKLDFKDLQILCRVKSDAPEKTELINTAEITKYQDEDGENLPEDFDSKPENVPEKNKKMTLHEHEDDEDVDYILIKKKKVDIALSKFIAAVSQDTTIEDGEYITADGKQGSKQNPYLRATKVDTTPLKNGEHDAIYTKDKTPLVVPAKSYVLYDIRVYNEGEVDLYAGEVTDYLPTYLDFVSCDFNSKYKWSVGEDGKTIKTAYLSYEYENEHKNEKQDNLLKAFGKVKDDGTGSHLDYRDLQILCRVNDNAPSNTNIVNVAEITKYEDEDGEDITEDVDSTPDNVEKKNEDDDDYEVVLIKTFDLALLKWVSTVYVTEDGVTKTTQTGNTGDDNTDIIPKVEINRKKINSTVVKFGYTIKITNEGDIAGAATEITDYVPQGLKFYKEDNNGWEEKSDGVITTRLLENTILEPGESAEVTVIFRWINGANNLGLKTNIAEISEDFNKEGIPDKDSTPGNKVWGEDDIDDAQVILSISTGLVEHIVMYTTFGLIVLAVFAGGIIGIKKFVL